MYVYIYIFMHVYMYTFHAVAKDYFATCSRGVAAVAKDAATTKCLPFRACQGRILLEAGSAKF